MSRRSYPVALAVVCALTGVTAIVAAQPPLDRNPGHGLTGTYQLENGRGDDPAQAAHQATRMLPVNQRQATYQRLMSRLHAPKTIAIDRNVNSVTVASSYRQRVTFEADGRMRTEQQDAGRSVDTRATLYGDQLVVTTAGSGGDGFAVTFESIDNGRSLRLTRRIHDDSLSQPVTLRNVYRRSSDDGQWENDSIEPGAPSQTDSAAHARVRTTRRTWPLYRSGRS